MKRRFALACLAALLVAGPAAPVDRRPVQQLPKVDVVGKVPSPPIWELRRGDKTLWIVGTLYPVPKSVPVDKSAIERRIAQSQVVVGPMGMSVGEEIGAFRTLFLVPALLKARNNPGGKTLQDVLPPATYARWSAAKAKYIGRDKAIEKRRPLYAAFELFDAAMKRQGLAPVEFLDIERLAKRQRKPVRDAKVVLEVDSPRKALKQFHKTALPDVQCLEETLDRIETDLGSMHARAEAWAEGDIGRMRQLPYREQFDTCVAALGANDLARKRGLGDIKAQVEGRWLVEVRKALREHDRVLATLPVRRMLSNEGPLAQLQSEGFVIVPPEQAETAIGQ